MYVFSYSIGIFFPLKLTSYTNMALNWLVFQGSMKKLLTLLEMQKYHLKFPVDVQKHYY